MQAMQQGKLYSVLLGLDTVLKRHNVSDSRQCSSCEPPLHNKTLDSVPGNCLCIPIWEAVLAVNTALQKRIAVEPETAHAEGCTIGYLPSHL